MCSCYTKLISFYLFDLENTICLIFNEYFLDVLGKQLNDLCPYGTFLFAFELLPYKLFLLPLDLNDKPTYTVLSPCPLQEIQAPSNY